jgi:DNA invertase Pin-like site-specific DNA recombinase
MRTVLYCWVSTADQILKHQPTQAAAAGFRFDDVVADHGISGRGSQASAAVRELLERIWLTSSLDYRRR